MYSETTATKRVTKLKKRIRAVQGGTSASKTVSIVLYLIAKAQTDKKPTLTSIVSESFPHLKRGVCRDFLLIMQEHGYYKDKDWNKTDYTYTFETGSKIEFFSADQPDKVRGPRRDRLFINECNNIPFDAFDQLEVRTKDFIFLDWNPTNEFWFYDKVKDRGDVDHIILTYKDNEALSQNIIDSIEQRKGRKGWWSVYGEGQLGEVEGKIYSDWKIIDEIPHEARLDRIGLDFGFTNDPSTAVAVYYHDGGYILDEILYRKGMLNKEIADFLKNQRDCLVVADSAEPKSIEDIRQYGVNITGAKKAKQPGGGLKTYNQWAINQVQERRISVTKRSINLIKEYRNYLWQTDKNGKILNIPEPGFDHCLDAVKYAIISLVPVIRREEHRQSYRQPYVKPKGNPAR